MLKYIKTLFRKVRKILHQLLGNNKEIKREIKENLQNKIKMEFNTLYDFESKKVDLSYKAPVRTGA